ncbi:PHD Zn-finger protein [Phaffia rhodozyma]|uniref:PHD Zn-finger protein n=1 Tax=Phaffia rhodozyma TaxID=264483 RepID=A0A0F7SGF3_PHARH|nr:PHD Zn-finger protein [Phaffia rhodozyma]
MDALHGTPSFSNQIQAPAILSSYPLAPSHTPPVIYTAGVTGDGSLRQNGDVIGHQVEHTPGAVDVMTSQKTFLPDGELGFDPSRASSASTFASVIDVDVLTGRMDGHGIDGDGNGDRDAERVEEKRDLKRSFAEVEGSSDGDGGLLNGGEIEGDEEQDRDGDGDDGDETIVVLSELDRASGLGTDLELEIKKPRRGRPPGSKSQKGPKPKSRTTPYTKKTMLTSSVASTSRSRKLTPARPTNGSSSHHTSASLHSPSRASSANPLTQSISFAARAPSPTSAELRHDLQQLRAVLSPFSPPHSPAILGTSAVDSSGVEGGGVTVKSSEASIGAGNSRTRIGSNTPRKASRPDGVPSSPLSDAPETGGGRDGTDADFEGISSARVGSGIGSSRRGGNPRFVDGGPSLRRGTPVGGDSKGKGKEIDGIDGQVENDFPQLNNDYCEACKGIGRFLCCDGCPRSFHFLCLDPPIDFDNIPEEQWFCKECSIRRSSLPVPNPPPNIFSSLIHQVQMTNPIQFKLPVLIRSHFKGVSVAPNGSYVNSEELRPMKADRTGFVVDRDPYRVKDGKGQILSCYRCGGSAAPLEGSTEVRPSVVAGKPSIEVASWRKMISCDYCNLHWHFDCLSPPLATMPQISKKWTCPLHADHVTPKIRVPKQGLEYINLTGPFQRNNGQIEVIPSADPNRVPFEDMLVNSKRYRVPESSIRLDFWRKATIERARRMNGLWESEQRKEEESDVEMNEDQGSEESESIGYEASSARLLSSSPPPPSDHLPATVVSGIETKVSPKLEELVRTEQDLQEGSAEPVGSDVDAEGEVDPDYILPPPPTTGPVVLPSSTESRSQSLKLESEVKPGENGQIHEPTVSTPLEACVSSVTSSRATNYPTIQKITLRLNRNSASPGPPGSQKPPPPPSTHLSAPVSAPAPSRDERGESLGSTNSLEGLDLSFAELSQLMAVRDLIQTRGKKQILEFLTS